LSAIQQTLTAEAATVWTLSITRATALQSPRRSPQRAQAHQRAGCPEQQQPPLLAVKELEPCFKLPDNYKKKKITLEILSSI